MFHKQMERAPSVHSNYPNSDTLSDNIMTAQLIIPNNITKYVNSLYIEANFFKLSLFFMKTNLCSTDPVNLDEKVLLKIISFFSPACYSRVSPLRFSDDYKV